VFSTKAAVAGLAVAVCFGTARPVLAQGAKPAGRTATTEISGGFTLQTWNSGFGESKGFAVDFARVVTRMGNHDVRVFADFARNRFTGEETDTSVVGGLRWRLYQDGRAGFFVHGSAGVVHWVEDPDPFFPTGSGNDLMFGGGGGVQFDLTRRLAARGQVDFWMERDSDFHDWDLISRVYASVVIKLGGK